MEPTEAEIRWLYGEQPDSWLPIKLSGVSDDPPMPPTLGGLNLVYPGKRHLFSGPQESAKTLAAYIIGLSVVRDGGRTMLIDFEMGPRDAKRRLRELGATDEELESIDYIEPETPLTAERSQTLVDRAPDLVIVDAAAGAYDLQGLDDNKRGDVERFASLYVRPFWRAEIATLTLDHVVKNAEARGNYAIGSERKAGGADVHLGFTVLSPIKRGTSGRYQLTTHKDRIGFHKRGKLATFELSSDPETHSFTWAFVPVQVGDDEHPFRPTGLMEKVSRFLELQHDPVSRNTVESAKLGKRDYVRLALDLLTEDGHIDETLGANRARLVEVVRVYREDSDEFAPGSPKFAPETEDSGSPVRPTPYGGGELRADLPQRGELDDGIPF